MFNMVVSFISFWLGRRVSHPAGVVCVGNGERETDAIDAREGGLKVG